MKKSVSLRPQMIGVWRSWLSALAWGARGRPFESDHPDSEKKKRHQLMSLFLLWLFGKNEVRAKMLVVVSLIPVRGCISVAEGVPVCGPNPREGIHKAVWSAAVHRRWFWRWRRYEKYDATVLVLHNPSGYLTKDSVGPAFT